MAPEVRLDVQVRQGLFLSPEQRQAIELMVKPIMEVAAWVQEELTQNPILDDADSIEDVEPVRPEEKEAPDDAAKLQDDEDWLRNFHDGSDLGYVSSRRIKDEDLQSIEHIKVEVPTLAEHLLGQYRLVAPPHLVTAGEFLIRSLDDRGFCTLSAEEAAQQISVSPDQIQAALLLIQTLDPPGVGARDLKGSLLIQLDHLEESSLDYVRPIVEHHLDDLIRKNYKKIGSALKIRAEKVMEAAEIIGSLNPFPARDYGGGETKYIVPDLFVREVEGQFEVIVNENPMPRLMLNPRYVDLFRRGVLSREEKAYLKEKMTNARWLINTLHQRNLSLYLVARYIIDYEPDFFRGQFDQLRPLTLKQVADSLGLSISTVSRLSNQKYADTPVGLYQLKFFFSNSVQTEGGRVLSSRSVKQKIKHMIESEDVSDPLSDVTILERLKQEGIHIQRRTVAKYREAMGILPRRLRRSAARQSESSGAELALAESASVEDDEPGGDHAVESDGP